MLPLYFAVLTDTIDLLPIFHQVKQIGPFDVHTHSLYIKQIKNVLDCMLEHLGIMCSVLWV